MKLRMLLRSIFTATLLSASANVAFAQDKVTLMVNWYFNAEHIPYFLGDQQGFFKDENIELEIQEGRGSGVTVQAVAAGSVDFGYADIGTMIKGASKGAPVKSVGVLLQTSPFAVISFESSEINEPSDLVGKTVAVTPGDSLSQLWPNYLAAAGLSNSDVKSAAGDAQSKMNLILSGRADAILGYSHDQGVALAQATGRNVQSLQFADLGINVISSGVIASDSTIAERPELVERFMRAMVKSVEAAAKDPEAAADALLAMHPNAGDRIALYSGFQAATELFGDDFKAGGKPFDIAPELVSTTLELMQATDALDASASTEPSDYVTTEFLAK